MIGTERDRIQLAASVWFAKKPQAEQDAILSRYPARVFRADAIRNAFVNRPASRSDDG